MISLLVFLHIIFTFAGVAAAYAPEAMFAFAVRQGRTEALRAVGASVAPITRLIPILFALGGVFGLLAAIAIGYDLLAPWLVISYVLFVVLTLIGALVTGRQLEKVGKIVANQGDGPFSPEVDALVHDRTFIAILVVDFLLLLAVIYVMVAKPFI